MWPPVELVGGPRDGHLTSPELAERLIVAGGHYEKVDETTFYRWIPE